MLHDFSYGKFRFLCTLQILVRKGPGMFCWRRGVGLFATFVGKYLRASQVETNTGTNIHLTTTVHQQQSRHCDLR